MLMILKHNYGVVEPEGTREKGDKVFKIRSLKRSSGSFEEFVEWWEGQREKCQEAWDEHEDKEFAMEVATDEYDYRNEELRNISQRTVMFITVSSLILAVCGWLVNGQSSTFSKVIAVGGGLLTVAALALCLTAFMPARGSWRKTFRPAEDWVRVIKDSQDKFAKIVMNANRKAKPIDRYKLLHFFVVRLLIASIVLAGVAFLFR